MSPEDLKRIEEHKKDVQTELIPSYEFTLEEIDEEHEKMMKRQRKPNQNDVPTEQTQAQITSSTTPVRL